jgi:YbbR domain-containing protein
VRRTPGLLLLSTLLAVSLWVFVTDTENPTVLDQFPQPIPVEAVNVAESLAVANQLPALNVRVSAPADRWERLTAANIRAFVDLNGFDARAQEVPVQVEITGLSGVRVVDTEPRAVTVNLEDLVSRLVPVRARSIGSLPIGYELGSMEPRETAVTVTGPESLVALVSEVAADVNVTGLTVNLEQAVTLKPLGAGGSEIRGVRIEPTSVRVGVEVLQSTIVRTVPLSVEVTGTPAAGYRVTSVSISPPAVQVQGALEASQQVDTIALPAVNVNGARSDIVRSVAVPLPSGLAFVNVERVTITVTLEPLAGSIGATLLVTEQGLAATQQATFDPQNVRVVLEGPLPLLNALAPGEVTAFVDLAGLPAGVHTRAVEFDAPEGVTIRSVQPESVTVTITAR